MYWSRTGSLLDFGPALLLCLLWGAGGWLLALHAFGLRRRESLLAGLAIGLLLFIVAVGLVAQVLPLTPALWLAGALILALGAAAAWRAPHRTRLWRQALRGWPQVLVLAGLVVLFALINRGLAIFDDYHNLPLVSVMAAGDVPPHFYLNPTQRLAYHYGLHLFAASLVRVGGLFPWSAFDLSKAISLALAVCLAYLWFRRSTRSSLAGFLGAPLALFGGGARWLLLFLPVAWLVQWSGRLQLWGSAAASGTDLYSALANPWNIEGAGPIPFPFAFANGVTPPLLLALGGPGAVPQLTLALLLLLARRRWQPLTAVLYGLLLGSLALTGEHLFVLAWGGLFLAAILLGREQSSWRERWPWILLLLTSAATALFAGGVITELARGLLPGTATAESFGFAGFGLRWPPALVSAHLGPLALTDPSQVVIALAEIGPLVLLLPWVAGRLPRQLRRGRWAWAGLALASLLGLGLPIFVRYGVERDISRLTSSSAYIWILLGTPLVWMGLQRSRSARLLAGAGYGLAVLGGLALFSLELVSLPRPQFSYFIQAGDAQLSRQAWDRLEPGTQVLDLNLPYRAVTLFGRSAGRAFQDLYQPFPEWEALAGNPDPARLAQAGYGYVYIDKAAWQALSAGLRAAYQAACVRRVGEALGDGRSDFRRLVDIRGCR